MLDYLSEEEYDYLKSYLIPNYSLSEKSFRDALISDDQNWVLKPKSAGRGNDVYIKSETSDWDLKLRSNYSNYIVQQYIEQEAFVFIENDTMQHIHLVGMLLFKNDQSFGAGVFRASSKHISKSYGGRPIILPCKYS